MMMEEGALAGSALPVADLRDHLNLGDSDGGAADGLLGSCLRAAMAAIEARTGKVLIARPFRWRFGHWRSPEGQPLPLAPVGLVHEVALVDATGTAEALSPERWQLRPDLHRPLLRMIGGLPAIPADGWVEISFTAGFGASWAELPADLRQAVLMLAARYFEDRAEAGQVQALPFGVMSLIERFRSVRILGGGRR